MAGMFGTPQAAPQQAPVAPSLADDTVQRATEAELTRQRHGRASTILTNPQTQRPPSDLTGA